MDGSDNVYVVDQGNDRIQKFQAPGRLSPSGAQWARETASLMLPKGSR
ncbi:MAG: hypothetical protein V3V49_05710 [Candidatus Krumholzibacteria bacterium]